MSRPVIADSTIARRPLGNSGLDIAPLVLGGNVFGWTADRETSFAILDAFLDAGFNAIDTADVYNRFAPGLSGGESETIIGDWMQDRGVRDDVVLMTKGGLDMGYGEGLGRDYLSRALDRSLRRLKTDRIDVYFAHKSDPSTPIVETLETFQEFRQSGKIAAAGASNFTALELEEALAASRTDDVSLFSVFQPRYNLADRAEYETSYEQLCQSWGLAVIPYYALAAGFLTGKYRKESDLAGSSREKVAGRYLTQSGINLLSTLDEIAAKYASTPTQISLAWLGSRRTISAPIASATTVAQLHELIAFPTIQLDPADLNRLDEARVF